MQDSGPEKRAQDVSNFLSQNKDLDTALNTAIGPLQYTDYYVFNGDPKKQLLLGQTPAPGNRTFLDIQQTVRGPGGSTNKVPKQCFDSSGNPHNLSVMINTVQPENRGLLYSLFESAQELKNNTATIDVAKNSYECKPVKVPVSDIWKYPMTEERYVLKQEVKSSPANSKEPFHQSRDAVFSEYEKNPIHDPIVWFYFGSMIMIFAFMIYKLHP